MKTSATKSPRLQNGPSLSLTGKEMADHLRYVASKFEGADKVSLKEFSLPSWMLKAMLRQTNSDISVIRRAFEEKMKAICASLLENTYKNLMIQLNATNTRVTRKFVCNLYFGVAKSFVSRNCSKSQLNALSREGNILTDPKLRESYYFHDLFQRASLSFIFFLLVIADCDVTLLDTNNQETLEQLLKAWKKKYNVDEASQKMLRFNRLQFIVDTAYEIEKENFPTVS